MGKLTARGVATTTKVGRHGDGGGLYLQVTATATKSWIFSFMLAGRPRQMGLGPVALVTLAQARDEAIRCRQLLRQGIDPIDHRRAAKVPTPSMTFSTFADRWIENHEAAWRSPKTAPQWRHALATYASAIANRPVGDIGSGDVVEVLRPIWLTKRETARKLRARLMQLFDAAKAMNLHSGGNPAAWRGNLGHLLPALGRSTAHHTAMPYDHVPGFFISLREQSLVAARALEFLVLTATRSAECIGAKWQEVNADIWVIPAGRTKTGVEFRVPLAPPALQLLSQLPREGDYIFVGARVGKPLGHSVFQTLLGRMGVVATAHGFRSSFRDWAAETTSTPNHVVEMALAHAVGGVEAAYRRGDLFEQRRALMVAWAAFCVSRV